MTPYQHVEKNINKEKKTKHIYIAHTQLHTDKKKPRKKKTQETHLSTFFSIYMKKLITKVSGKRIVCYIIRFIFAPFHIVGLQLIV